MHDVNIFLEDEDFNGTVIMTSRESKIKATRVSKNRVSDFERDLNGLGIYLLLIDNDSIYVGETGLDTLKNRIMNKHTGEIDNRWHTVLAFKFDSPNITKNELLYMENAMCEYVFNHYGSCETTNPSRDKCNNKYRKSKYNLETSLMLSCDRYLNDMKFLISLFPRSIFPPKYLNNTKSESPLEASDSTLFYAGSPNSKYYAKTEIFIESKAVKKIMLKAGSIFSEDVADYVDRNNKIKEERKRLESEGIIVDRILKADLERPSYHEALAFVSGASINAKTKWTTAEGNTLAEYLD